MKKLFKFSSVFSILALFPALALAAFGTNVGSGVRIITNSVTSCIGGNGLGVLICNIQRLLNSIVPLLLALGVVYFVWGVVQYVINDSEEAKKKGRDRIVYGIIGFAIIIGLWGLVALVVRTFGLAQITAVEPLIPQASLGCELPSNPAFQNYLKFATCTINDSIIPLIFAIAVIMFIWGVVKFFILNADEEAKRAQGKQFMIWGIVALAVMLSVWGLVGVLRSTFGMNDSFLPQVCPPGDPSC